MAAPNSTFCVSTCCAQPELNDGAHQKRPRATSSDAAGEPSVTSFRRVKRRVVTCAFDLLTRLHRGSPAASSSPDLTLPSLLLVKRHELPDTAAIYVVMAGDTALMTCKGKSED